MALHETSDQLRTEIARLRASRERLVHAADADLRALERDLHRGVQQQLVSLAVDVQLLEEVLESDPVAARACLLDLGRDLQQALDEAGQLAYRIHPPLLEAGGLPVALRAAATAAGVRATIEIGPPATHQPETARTIYSCFLTALEGAERGTHATVRVRAVGGEIAFEIATTGAPADAELEVRRDRIDTLGGRLTTRAAAGEPWRMTGSFPNLAGQLSAR